MLSLNLKRIIKQKHCGVKFRKLKLNMSSNKILFQLKTKLQAKKLGQLHEKTAENLYLYVDILSIKSLSISIFCRKHFSKSKSYSLNAAQD